jgi:hypothetical protein
VPRKGDPSYDKYRDQQADISRERSERGREIGPLPECENPARRNACLDSLRAYCQTYRAATFCKPFSSDHLKAIAKLETAVLTSGLFALAMPRGSGKTSLTTAAAEWAVLYGHRRFVVLIGATAEAAVELLDSIKVEFETNELLLADFPEAVYPIVRLEGIAHRANGQLLDGERTRITWTNDELVMPTVPGSPSSGARIRVAGITGRVRGMSAKTADGATIRPDFAVADDPQTDESAESPVQTDRRERTLMGAVKGLAGPGKTIAMAVPCTVIHPHDLADRLLDRDRHPEFQGDRFRLVYSLPLRQDLWDEYAEIRIDSLRHDRDGSEATDFYRANRDAMDAGCVVAWPERFDPEREVSAVQAAMNLRIDSPRAFAAEYQNEPESTLAAGAKSIDGREAVRRASGTPRGQVPAECDRLTAFVDVGGQLLWYAVCAWDGRFNGTLIDYGCFPKQTRSVFAATDPRPGLADVYPGLSEPQRVYAGLGALLPALLGPDYPRAGGGPPLKVGRCLVDAGDQSDAVYKSLRASPLAGLLLPSKGVGRSTTQVGVARWKARTGERTGYHWKLTLTGTGQRLLQFDPDAWKTFLFDRLSTPPGGAGALTVFGTDDRPHTLLADHLSAEYAEPATLKGDTFDKWQARPHRPDNHLLDCLVGACVAASADGLAFHPGGQPAEPKAGKVRLSELQAKRRQAAGAR